MKANIERRNFRGANAARAQHIDQASLQTGRMAPRMTNDRGNVVPRSESHGESTLADYGVSYSFNEDPRTQADMEKTFHTLSDKERRKEDLEFHALQRSMLEPKDERPPWVPAAGSKVYTKSRVAKAPEKKVKLKEQKGDLGGLLRVTGIKDGVSQATEFAGARLQGWQQQQQRSRTSVSGGGGGDERLAGRSSSGAAPKHSRPGTANRNRARSAPDGSSVDAERRRSGGGGGGGARAVTGAAHMPGPVRRAHKALYDRLLGGKVGGSGGANGSSEYDDARGYGNDDDDDDDDLNGYGGGGDHYAYGREDTKRGLPQKADAAGAGAGDGAGAAVGQWRGRGDELLGGGIAPPRYVRELREEDGVGGGGDDYYFDDGAGELPEGILPRAAARRRAEEAENDRRLEKELIGGGVFSPKKRSGGGGGGGEAHGNKYDDDYNNKYDDDYNNYDDDENDEDPPPPYTETAQLGETLGYDPYTASIEAAAAEAAAASSRNKPDGRSAFEKLPPFVRAGLQGERGPEASTLRAGGGAGGGGGGAAKKQTQKQFGDDDEEEEEVVAAGLSGRARELDNLIDELEAVMHDDRGGEALARAGRAAGRRSSNEQVLEMLRAERTEVRRRLDTKEAGLREKKMTTTTAPPPRRPSLGGKYDDDDRHRHHRYNDDYDYDYDYGYGGGGGSGSGDFDVRRREQRDAVGRGARAAAGERPSSASARASKKAYNLHGKNAAVAKKVTTPTPFTSMEVRSRSSRRSIGRAVAIF